MKKTQLIIDGLTQSHASMHSSAFILLLKEQAGLRTLPIVIAHPEAQSIAIELEKMKPPRPCTHDLFKTFAGSFGIKLNEVIIYDLKEGIFYAKLICDQGGKIVEIDSRTSDAVALAVRFKCPIFTYVFILKLAGTDTSTEKETPKQAEKTAVKRSVSPSQTIKELQKKLKEALEIEDYESATRLRDEISRLKNQQ